MVVQNFSPNLLFSSQQTATESAAEEKKKEQKIEQKTTKKKVGKPIGDPVGGRDAPIIMSCVRMHYRPVNCKSTLTTCAQ